MGAPKDGDGTRGFERPVDILILPARVAGNGLNLTRSNLMIQFDVIPVSWLQQQIMKRNHRCGQMDQCVLVQLLLYDSDDLDNRRMKQRALTGALTLPLLKDDPPAEGRSS
ncbi:hypothetical protein LTR22_028454, partial [Elasticomyces elasticus]